MIKQVSSFYADIYIAGDYDTARAICREYCDRGACVTVSKTSYIYTHGEEQGIRVGFVNYPRFPKDPDVMLVQAQELANLLMERLHQGSYLIQTPTDALWYSRRPQDNEN